jgi:hypothetical protein
MPELEPPPTSEEEERRRRARITIAELVKWYLDHHIPLDVPLTVYQSRGNYEHR